MIRKACLIGVCFIIGFFLTKIILYLYTENERLNNNIIVLNSDIEKFENKNGDLTVTVQNLELKNKELKLYNDSLVSDLEASGVKIKNLTHAISIKAEPKVVIKEIITEKEYTRNDSAVFLIDQKDNYFSLNAKAIVPPDLSILKLEDLKFELKNVDISIGNETKYKGIWFWKRIVGYKTTVVCKNKYFNITETKSYKFD